MSTLIIECKRAESGQWRQRGLHTCGRWMDTSFNTYVAWDTVREMIEYAHGQGTVVVWRREMELERGDCDA